ncbi:hypothetical protein ACFYNY_34465 [Streptomyces sp. NPDC006530]|uniref:hypothetical protein n=1 Tax=Streptomyces sp. NPDC006530 TaxID=3364750 RepID=UPI0036BD732D
MRAALAVADPTGTELALFSARFEAARFGIEQDRVLSDARRFLALRTRPEVQAAIQSALTGEETTPVDELWAWLERRDAAR